MLRLYLLQNLYNLSDMQTSEQVIDSRAFSDFCSISSPEEVPDGDTIGRFRNLLIKAGVQEMLFAQVITLLRKKDLILKKNAKNLLFELKLNMSSLLSKIFSLFVKLDTGVNENSLLN